MTRKHNRLIFQKSPYLLQQGIHPKIVSERLGHSSIAITLDTYSHILPGLQEAAARKFDEGLQDVSVEMPETAIRQQNVSKMLANLPRRVVLR